MIVLKRGRSLFNTVYNIEEGDEPCKNIEDCGKGIANSLLEQDKEHVVKKQKGNAEKP
jgi:hypothetical protein